MSSCSLSAPLSKSECCLVVPSKRCCFEVPPRPKCCFEVPHKRCCFTVERNAMSQYRITNDCCVPRKKCCVKVCEKGPNDIKSIRFRWHEVADCEMDQENDCVVLDGEWSLKSVVHTITLSDGSPLPGNPDDPTIPLLADGVTPMDKVYPNKYLSHITVAGGVAGEKYRVSAHATFMNCEGFIEECGYCVNLMIEECCP